jgi:hypothetical protein
MEFQVDASKLMRLIWPRDVPLLNFAKKKLEGATVNGNAAVAAMRRLFYLLIILTFLVYTMTKCIGCKREFNNQGYPSHKKSCKLFKRAMRERLNKIPDYGAGPSTSNEEMVTEPAGEPADLGEMLVDDVQVPFYL